MISYIDIEDLLPDIQGEVKRLDQEHVEFVGWVKDKKAFFERLDLFCLPSLAEPFGIILLEAMLFDTTIIAADAEGPKEIITDMKDGILVRKESPYEMAEAIEELLNDPTLAARLADKAFLTVRQKYDINIVGQRLAAYLQKIKTSHEAKHPKSQHNKTSVRTYDSHL